MNLAELLTAQHERECYKLCPLNFPVEDVTAEWGGTLSEIHKTMPGVVLVGGAVRDVFFGRPVKDLDFMTVNQGDIELMQAHLNKPLFNCLRHVPEAVVAKYAQAQEMVSAWETEDKGVNLLYVKSIMGRIREFPDSISQCWTNGEHVYATPAFMIGYMTMTVTLQKNCTAEREQRLQAKYPDFKFEYEI